MLSQRDNEIVTQVGPDTLMGRLLRRYWTPALLSSEIAEPDCPPVRVKLLGEDLVAFRDSQGRTGLVEACCPHRGVSLFFGRNEESGLRCVYHGWKFDVNGRCVDMPTEPPNSTFQGKLSVQAYPTHESGGIVWTYMGPPDKMTGFRDFGTETLPRSKWRATKRKWPNNWMTVMENGFDSSHPSWLHYWSGAADLAEDDSDAPGTYNSINTQWKIWLHDRSPRIEVVDAWHGFRAAGLRKTPKGNVHARMYSFIIPYTGGTRGAGGFWVVPADDNETMNFSFATINTELWNEVVLGNGEGSTPGGFSVPSSPYAEPGPPRSLQNDWLIDRDLQMRGSVFTGIADFNAQDGMAVQGSFTDRTREHLGTLDAKIIRFRRILLNAAKNLAKGIDPPAIDPSLPYYSIGSPSKVLAPGDDWRVLGTAQDPDFQRICAPPPSASLPPMRA